MSQIRDTQHGRPAETEVGENKHWLLFVDVAVYEGAGWR